MHNMARVTLHYWGERSEPLPSHPKVDQDLYTKEIMAVERVQRRATKYLLNDYSSVYKTRHLRLKLLPIMTWFEFQDNFMFLVKINAFKKTWKNLPDLSHLMTLPLEKVIQVINYKFSLQGTIIHDISILLELQDTGIHSLLI